MSTGIHGHGTTLAYHGTTVGNIISIGGPDQSRDPIDISTMGSTDKWREFIPGMADAGELTFECNFDGTTVSSMLNTQLDATYTRTTATTNNVVVTFSDTDTATFTCDGFITALGHAIPFDDKVTQSVTIKLDGSPTFAAA